jgi:hypothetical protein
VPGIRGLEQHLLEHRKSIESGAALPTKRPKTIGTLVLALSFALAAPATRAEPKASPRAPGASSRACQALYVQKLREARDALARHESERAADYLVAAKEALSDCMKEVPTPSGSQNPDGEDPHLLSDAHSALVTRQGGSTGAEGNFVRIAPRI